MPRGTSASPRGLPCRGPLTLAVPFFPLLAQHMETLSLVCGLAAEWRSHVEKAGKCWGCLLCFLAVQDNELALEISLWR